MDRLNEVAGTFQTDELITIEVGTNEDPGGKATFKVHKPLLCDASDYFKKALDGQFKEASERCIRLPGADLDTVKVFLYFITKKAMPRLRDENPNDDADSTFQLHKLLANVWMLGEHNMMPEMKVAAMGEIIATMSVHWTPAEAIVYCYERGRGTLLQEAYVQQAQYEWLNTENISHHDMAQFAKVERAPGRCFL